MAARKNSSYSSSYISSSTEREYFESRLAGKRIPVLTLDNNWHILIEQAGLEIPELNMLEDEVNELMKRQGGVNTKIPEVKNYKKKLLEEIMNLAAIDDAAHTNDHLKQIQQKQKLVEECNELLLDLEDEKEEIPEKIREANKKLMVITMEYCYKKMQENTTEINEITAWEKQVREELKDRLGTREELRLFNKNLYTYMHNIFGADIIDIYDNKYSS